MRVYHFLSSEYGLSDIALKRIKISRIGDLNDPFELLAANVGGRIYSEALQSWKRDLNDTVGLLCFSKKWENPVLWSHYAAKHYGFCLGFNLNDGIAVEVKYSKKRIELNFDGAPTSEDLTGNHLLDLLGTKFESWSYEEEVRVFVYLDKKFVEGASYFYDFSGDLELREVILGPLCNIPIQRVQKLVGELYDRADVSKARLAYKLFKVVPDKRYEDQS